MIKNSRVKKMKKKKKKTKRWTTIKNTIKSKGSSLRNKERNDTGYLY